MYSFIHAFIHSFIHQFTNQPFIHLSILHFIHSHTIHLSTPSVHQSSIHSSTYLSILPFINSSTIHYPSIYPLFLVHTQDPTSSLLVLAEQLGMGERFQSVSLGQGQAPRAKRMIENGAKEVTHNNYVHVIVNYMV